jgi:hypothetical protein
VLEANIAAPAERIWKAFAEHLADADAAALHTSIVSIKEVHQDPPTHEYVVDTTGGRGTHHRTVQIEILQAHAGEYQETRTIQQDGKPLPYGPEHTETVQLQPVPSGTKVTMTWRGETANWGEFIARRIDSRAWLQEVKQFYESGDVPPKRIGTSLRWSLTLSLIAVGTFVLGFGWLPGLFLTAALILHEFGHWIAMRFTGQPAPRIMLVPFFGGVTLANHPHKTLFRDAFCALMGAGVSALPSLVSFLRHGRSARR